MLRQQLLLSLTVLVLLAATGQPAIVRSEHLPAGSTPQRDKVTVEELMAGEYNTASPVDNGYFMAVGEPAPAAHAFEGILTVPTFEMANTAPASLQRNIPSVRLFPAFSAPFFTYEDHLVPVERGILCPQAEQYWCIILSPGKVWSEPGDQGLDRASFPFALVNEWGNNTHNGLATFLYDSERISGRISGLRFQIVQETAPDREFQFDAWGQAPATYQPGPVADREALIAAYAREQARMVPLHQWSDLETLVDGDLLERFGAGIPTQQVSAAGLVMDGEIYLQPVVTRHGTYPYPRHMRHGVYSVTKSMGAAVSLLRLVQRYGAHVLELRLADYVEIRADHSGWEEVTFRDALNMATGVGETAPDRGRHTPGEDEGQPRFLEFILARSAQVKLAVAFSYPDYRWGPGEVMRYNSINTFVLSAGMDRFLKQQEGPDAHLWDVVGKEVLEPIGVFHLPTMHTAEEDESSGLPLLFMGLYPTVDDVAKITSLMQAGGQHGDQPLLDAALLEEGLRWHGPAGLPNSVQFPDGEGTYHLSFWAMPYRTGDGRLFQVPYMAGLGGNTVVLAPNGLSGFLFTDANQADPYAMVRLLEALRPFPERYYGGQDAKFLLLSLPTGVRPSMQRWLLVADRALLIWLLLTVVALVIFACVYFRGWRAPAARSLPWLLAVAFLGPLGLSMYLVAARRERAARSAGRPSR